jgi:hypothetical protein
VPRAGWPADCCARTSEQDSKLPPTTRPLLSNGSTDLGCDAETAAPRGVPAARWLAGDVLAPEETQKARLDVSGHLLSDDAEVLVAVDDCAALEPRQKSCGCARAPSLIPKGKQTVLVLGPWCWRPRYFAAGDQQPKERAVSCWSPRPPQLRPLNPRPPTGSFDEVSEDLLALIDRLATRSRRANRTTQGWST